VLLADGTTKAIDQVKVGDTIADSVPGATGTEAHKVTAVIVTHTDHDFVDVTIRKTGHSSEPADGKSVKAGAKSLAKKAARKAALGLAASAAVLGALSGGHVPGDAHEPATAPAAAVSTVSSAQATQAGAQDAHLTTTFHHPFYDETRSAFVEAKDLEPGDILQTPAGTTEVTGVRLYHANTTTYDLTIGGLHTYYVVAGDTPLLVHNCGTGYNAAGKPCGCGAPRVFAVDSSGEATALPVHEIDRARFPDVADNFDNAIANGKSPIVNRLTGRSNIRANRNAAQAGQPRPGDLGTDANGGALSWEEFPFASTTQGGAGATLRLINRVQNTTHGRESLWPFLRDNGVNNGDPYYVRTR
jgi:hypothetical protein